MKERNNVRKLLKFMFKSSIIIPILSFCDEGHLFSQAAKISKIVYGVKQPREILVVQCILKKSILLKVQANEFAFILLQI